MSVTERGVETEVGQSAPTNVLLFRGNVGEDDAALRDTQFCGRLYDVALSCSGEAKEPEDAVWNLLQNGRPVFKRGGVDLVELVEVAEHDCALRQAILGSGSER